LHTLRCHICLLKSIYIYKCALYLGIAFLSVKCRCCSYHPRIKNPRWITQLHWAIAPFLEQLQTSDSMWTQLVGFLAPPWCPLTPPLPFLANTKPTWPTFVMARTECSRRLIDSNFAAWNFNSLLRLIAVICCVALP